MIETTLRPKPIVWTIAGSDSGGGAGIQADLATIHDLGCHGCSVITTLTAQSSVAVNLVESVTDAMLLSQLSTLASDLPPMAIKIGLIANQRQLLLLADWLSGFIRQYPQVPVIVDPVMVASCGDELGDDSISTEPLDFMPFRGLISLITPNVQELLRLTKCSNIGLFASSLLTKERFRTAAEWLSDALSCSVLAKGGDVSFDGKRPLAEDLLVCRDVEACSALDANAGFWLVSDRIETLHHHGSGCTLSSAIAAVLAQGFVLPDAVVVAKAYVNCGLTQAVGIGQGAGPLARTGWPHTITDFPKILKAGCDYSANLLASNSPEVKRFAFKTIDTQLGIYPVVDNLVLLEQLMVAGVKTVQLRVKADLTTFTEAELESQIRRAIALGQHYKTQLFINDHWQLALKYGAFGVHLGQEDLALCDLDAIHAANMALGLSSHGYFELLRAYQYSPSYIAIGHIFPTTTKQMPSRPQGVQKLSHYAKLLKGHCPTVAIGGIDLTNLPDLKATTVDNIAVVRAITNAVDPIAACNQLQQAWERRC
ncbi:thiamine phosphate synthase [Shewanella sp. A25]|nr:thiamine phosphate synthase [Shewanella shenzhenensis]